MLFNSLHFFIFFPLVTTGFFILPHRFRWIWLLFASCYFYMAFIPIYILILLFTISIDYVAGLLIEGARGVRRRQFLILSLIANIGVLAVFKYLNFTIGNLNAISHWVGSNQTFSTLGIILPIGLSFHTFQSMSYTIEVYRGRYKAERNLGIFALYVMFYPQLVAGPIERPQNLLTQLREKKEFNYARVADGLKLMLWGFFKKMVIADRISLFVNQVYENPTHYEGVSLVIATVFFAFQIYCDFSGYSDIAIGSAQVMGFRLMDNFKRPYFSKSIGEFWKRWHISLSSWFRDYLYIPLGGNRVNKPRYYFNVFLTFLLSGLWHGANWTFIVWGSLNGIYLIVSQLTIDVRSQLLVKTGITRHPNLLKYTRISTTFALINFSWIFFRSKNLNDAIYIVTHLFTGWGTFLSNITNKHFIGAYVLLSQRKWEVSIALISILILEIVHSIQRHGSIRHMLSERPAYVRYSIYYLLFFFLLFLGKYTAADFIYFQF
ncbi:MAG: MBOAT family protein [Elusimicrobia bacterium]|nr:MBOAT family protein [Candidatus Obscuribacterium magneticum]